MLRLVASAGVAVGGVRSGAQPRHEAMKLKRLSIAGAAVVLALLCYFLLRGPEGRLKLPAGPHAPMVCLGDSHGLILAPDGSLWSWGGEDRGFPGTWDWEK